MMRTLTLCFLGMLSAVSGILSSATAYGAEPSNDFSIMLDELQRETSPVKRGFDSDLPNDPKDIGCRVVKMVGRPDTYDPFGTQELRDTVIKRWRKHYAALGDKFLKGNQARKQVQGHQRTSLGEIDLSGKFDSNSPFFLNNSRIYELGAMDGEFPPMGRLLGDQSGIWTPPVKMLDGIAFTVREDGSSPWRVAECADFIYDLCSARFHFEQNALQIERHDFPAADEPALYVQLTLTNRSDRPRKLMLDFTGSVNIRPGWRTRWQNEGKNGLDVIMPSDTLFFANDPNIERSGFLLGSSCTPVDKRIVENEATLSCEVNIPANGNSQVLFLIYGGLESDTPGAHQRFAELVARAADELDSSEKRLHDRVFGGVRFSCSDRDVTNAFYLAKANLLLLTGDLRSYQPDKFLFAGLPFYTQLFACDTSLSLPGVLGVGMRDLAAGTLECLMQAGKNHDGLVPHETALDASHVGDSNAQETPQFISACWQYYLWTRDEGFLAGIYPFAKRCFAAAQKRYDNEDNGYFAGPALIEAPGMGPHKIDAACQQYSAIVSLTEMANALGQNMESQVFREQGEVFKTKFNGDWWMFKENMWADSLQESGSQSWNGFWSVIFPMLTGVAEIDKGTPALNRIEHEWVNQWGGVHTWQPDISQQGSGVVTSGLFGVAAFKYGKADFGWHMTQLAAKAPRQDRMLGAFTECIPPGGSDFIQLWSVGPFLECLIQGVGGIAPQPPQHCIDFFPNLPRALDSFKVENCQVADHIVSLEHCKTGNTLKTTITHSKGEKPLSGTLWLPYGAETKIDMDGRAVKPTKERALSAEMNLAGIEYELPVGKVLLINAEK